MQVPLPQMQKALLSMQIALLLMQSLQLQPQLQLQHCFDSVQYPPEAALQTQKAEPAQMCLELLTSLLRLFLVQQLDQLQTFYQLRQRLWRLLRLHLHLAPARQHQQHHWLAFERLLAEQVQLLVQRLSVKLSSAWQMSLQIPVELCFDTVAMPHNDVACKIMPNAVDYMLVMIREQYCTSAVPEPLLDACN